MPASLLDDLKTYQSRCRLSIDGFANYERHGSAPPLVYLSDLLALHSSPCLVSLAVGIPIEEPKLFAELHDAVLSCLSLKTLLIHAFAIGDMPPYSLTDCPWVPKPGQRTTYPDLRRLELRNICICAGDSRRWLGLFDWSSLSHAAFTCGSFTEALGEQLTNLKGLKMRLPSKYSHYAVGCRESHESFKRFLFMLHQLEELDLTSGTLVLDEEMFRHLGRSLKRLRLHESGTQTGRPVLLDHQLKQLGSYCPLIRRLAIDIDHERTWVMVAFKTHLC